MHSEADKGKSPAIWPGSSYAYIVRSSGSRNGAFEAVEGRDGTNDTDWASARHRADDVGWRRVRVSPADLFNGLGRRRKVCDVGLLGVMEAAAQRQGRGDDGKSNDGAHDSIPLL